jgi:hypothetical protein
MVGNPEPPRVIELRALTPEQERDVLSFAKRLASLPAGVHPTEPPLGRPSPRHAFVRRALDLLKKGLRK